MYACMHVCMYACLHVCMYARLFVCIFVHPFVFTYLLRASTCPSCFRSPPQSSWPFKSSDVSVKEGIYLYASPLLGRGEFVKINHGNPSPELPCAIRAKINRMAGATRNQIKSSWGHNEGIRFFHGEPFGGHPCRLGLMPTNHFCSLLMGMLEFVQPLPPSICCSALRQMNMFPVMIDSLESHQGN